MSPNNLEDCAWHFPDHGIVYIFPTLPHPICGPGNRSRYSDWLRAGRFGDRILVGARFSAPVQTGPPAHPVSCKMGTGSFPGVKSGQGVTLTTHPLLVPWSRKSRAIPLFPLWAERPVQSLSACTRVHFTFTFIFTCFLPHPIASYICRMKKILFLTPSTPYITYLLHGAESFLRS